MHNAHPSATSGQPIATDSNSNRINLPAIPASTVSSGTFSRWFNRLEISRKIGLGYALALGIALVGTTAGLWIGNTQERRAEAIANEGHDAGVLLTNLQVAILQARSHQQQFPVLLPYPDQFEEEYHHFVEHSNHVRSLLLEVKSSESMQQIPGIQSLLQTHTTTIDTYFQAVEALVQPIDPMGLPTDQMIPTQQRLLQFSSSEVALNLDDFSDRLSQVSQAAFEQEHQAEISFEQAQWMEVGLIAGSIGVSVVLASMLALLISRAIARPIEATTEVAKRVTEESNFDLQALVTTEDEVGILASSLNQLIQRVKSLLEAQKAEAAQQLIQNEKMSSLGKMIAGIAHEINNPVNFIYGNLDHTRNYFTDLLAVLDAYEAKAGDEAIEILIDEVDLPFVKDDLPKILQSMQVGADRVRQIVLSLKNFSRLDETELHPVDLHSCLENTLLILNNRVKKGITIVRDYGTIPLIEGYSGSLYQVLMNVLSNAIDVLEEQMAVRVSLDPEAMQPLSAYPPLIIRITTELCEHDWIVVKISDNGPGMADGVRKKVFEPFFTTKPAGVGTGLGLAISRQIIEEKHGGQLTCESTPGRGTTFAIALPIKQAASAPISRIPISAS